jgi:dihydrofolate reductase
MGDIVVFESVTLDGVMQAPGRPDEDTRDGFEHGGWAAPYADEVVMGLAGEGAGTTGAMLFGRRTYEDFAGFWPHQTDNPFTEPLNAARKYVVSTTMEEPLPWVNSVLVKEPTADAIAHVKEESDGDVLVLGSGALVRSLLVPERLADAFVLLIHPLVLGTGRRLFDGAPTRTELELVDTRTSTTGVIVARYRSTSSR